MIGGRVSGEDGLDLPLVELERLRTSAGGNVGGGDGMGVSSGPDEDDMEGFGETGGGLRGDPRAGGKCTPSLAIREDVRRAMLKHPREEFLDGIGGGATSTLVWLVLSSTKDKDWDR